MNLDSLARRISAGSTHRQHHHACLVLVGGALQAVGTNTNGGGTHAEVNALSQLWPNKRRGAKVYSLRWLKSGKLGMAKPCENCEQFLRESGVKTVYYSDRDGSIKRMKL